MQRITVQIHKAIVGCALIGLVAGCAADPMQTPASSGTTTSGGLYIYADLDPGPGIATISGGKLLRDGAAWTPKGLQLSAFVASTAVGAGVYAAAY